MKKISIPGRGNFVIQNLVLDLNGTISLDGSIIEGVGEKVALLSREFDILMVTADTNKNAENLIKDLNARLCRIEEGQEDARKLRMVKEIGEHETVSIGNGSNDVSMLRESALGICTLGREGAATEALMASDLVVGDINDALDLLIKPHRLIATLRK